MLLYNYPKVAFLQYCVSVGCGVVSLTKGTSVFPLGHGLPDHVQFHGQFLLRKSLGLAQIFDVFIQHGQNLLAMALS